jgi:hypothetical protein
MQRKHELNPRTSEIAIDSHSTLSATRIHKARNSHNVSTWFNAQHFHFTDKQMAKKKET